MKIHSLALFLLFISHTLPGQDTSRWSITPTLIGGIFPQYEYDLKEYNPLLIPYIPFSKGGFYGELRYNYDRNGTLGIYGGRSWSYGKNAVQLLTPQAGILVGDYRGISFQLYYSVIHRAIEFNFTNQYSWIFNNRPDFYFNWSDLQFPVLKVWRIGLSTQIFADNTIRTYDLGPMAGFRKNSWYAMVTLFNPWKWDKHFLFFAIQKQIYLK